MTLTSWNEAKKFELVVLLADETKKISGMPNDSALAAQIAGPLKSDFRGRYRESMMLYINDHAVTKRVLLLGTGPAAALTGHKLRTLGAQAVSASKSLGFTKGVGLLLPKLKKFTPAETAECMVQGAILYQLGFDQFKTDRKEEDKVKFETLQLTCIVAEKKDAKASQAGLERGSIIAEAVNWSRRLIMLPGGDLYPVEYVKHIQKMISSSPAKAKIKSQFWTEKELKQKGFGGVLGVAQGSDNPPRFGILEYMQGKKAEKPIVLVGKGVTFDSGGLSLKPPAGMETMKYDMAGSASVLGAFKIVTDLQLKVNLVVIVPMVENMPSGHAIRPGDVLRMASGKTVEVLNTDAEGRLILADALFWATTKYAPKAVVDVATLTGACAMAVGEAAAGVFTNNKKLLGALMNAGEEVQENLWPLPDFDDFYLPMVRSDIADIKNTGGREAGASTASIFLRYFVHNNVPWAHIDIAGCGWYDAPRDFIGMKGSSGIPIRLLAQFVENNANAKIG